MAPLAYVMHVICSTARYRFIAFLPFAYYYADDILT